MAANLDKRLNLVIEIEQSDGSTVYVHHTPIDRATFKSNYLLILKTVNSLYAQGLGMGACMQAGYMHLLKTAEELGTLPTVEKNFIPEIWRLTSVIVGGKPMPFEAAKAQLSEDDLEEVENTICFFTCASWMHTKKQREHLLYDTPYGLRIVSSNPTDFANSLMTSIADENIGAKAAPLSIAH